MSPARVSEALARSLGEQRKTAGAGSNKYGAKRETVDGVNFASKREAARYRQLKLLQQAGEIRSLKLQPRFPLKVFGKLITTYVADFQYQQVSDGKVVVEDAKGFKTPAYKIKAKLFEALIGFPVREV